MQNVSMILKTEFDQINLIQIVNLMQIVNFDAKAILMQNVNFDTNSQF